MHFAANLRSFFAMTDALLDPEILAPLLEIAGPDAVRPILVQFEAQIVEKQDALARAIDRRDFSGLRAHAHSLKGAAASLGAIGVAKIAAQLELDANKRVVLVDAIEDDLTDIRVAFERLRLAGAPTIAQLRALVDHAPR